MKLKFLMLLLGLIISQSSKAQENEEFPQLGKSEVEDVVAAMTLEEKLLMISGTGMDLSMASSEPVAGNVKGKVSGAAGNTYAIPRLGIPSMVFADGPAGLRIDSMRLDTPSKRYYATAFPIASSLASTWNTNLVREVGEAMGNEVLEYGVDILLAPGMNIQRNPRGGRNFEYYSEDPLLSGKMAAAMVNGIQSNGVGTSIKHFAVNNQETSRSSVNAIVSERAVRELYLKPFEIAIHDANPWTVMSSYNKINGIYASENEDLLSTILRDDWKFQGFVMTDWLAGRNYVAQVQAGNDMLMPGRKAEFKKIKAAIEDGTLSETILDRNIKHILSIVVKSPSYRKYNYTDKPDLKAHALISRKAAAEGMVLLKNKNQTLPLQKGAKIALIGNAAYETFIGGTGSGEVYKAYAVSLADGLLNANFNIDKILKKTYENHINTIRDNQPKRTTVLSPIKPISEKIINKNELQQMAVTSDIAIIAIARNAGEGKDRSIEVDFKLQPNEMEMIQKTTEAFHKQGKKVVVVLNNDAIIEMSSWNNIPDAILMAWLPGQEAGNAIADILSGKENPSGKLTSTVPLKYTDVPSAETFPTKKRQKIAVHNEGIYVGYRYYDTFELAVEYPFGFGLSYTNFSYKNAKISSKTFTKKISLSVKVKNIGKTEGKEIVQVFVSAPSKKLDKPEKELKAFAKTKVLRAGKSQKLTFTLTASDLASFDSKQSAWIVESGIYTIKIGASSRDIQKTLTFTLENDIVVKKVHKALIPKEDFQELKNR